MAGIFERMLLEVDGFLVGAFKVHDTLNQLARRLQELDIEFALAGGLAVGVKRAPPPYGGYRHSDHCRGDGTIQRGLVGSRLRREIRRISRRQRYGDRVSIDFLVSGGFPGDGRPKPVRFPDPETIPREGEPYRIVDLRTLIELKLASGMSAPDRLLDLADVIALVRANGLPREFADRLDPSVREKFHELWLAAQTKSEF